MDLLFLYGSDGTSHVYHATAPHPAHLINAFHSSCQSQDRGSTGTATRQKLGGFHRRIAAASFKSGTAVESMRELWLVGWGRK
jgi:hypothetical protein